MSKKSVAVEIAGHRYKIRTDSDEDSVRSIADDVDRAMQRVREETGTVDSLDVAILTCLNLAREILVLRGQPEDLLEGERMRGLIERVESVVPELKIAASDSGTPKSLSGAGTETATVTGQTQPEAASEPPRTLELPGVEVLRESAQLSTSTRAAEAAEAAEAADAEASVDEAPPEARMAVGGRDRTS